MQNMAVGGTGPPLARCAPRLCVRCASACGAYGRMTSRADQQQATAEWVACASLTQELHITCQRVVYNIRTWCASRFNTPDRSVTRARKQASARGTPLTARATPRAAANRRLHPAPAAMRARRARGGIVAAVYQGRDRSRSQHPHVGRLGVSAPRPRRPPPDRSARTRHTTALRAKGCNAHDGRSTLSCTKSESRTNVSAHHTRKRNKGWIVRSLFVFGACSRILDLRPNVAQTRGELGRDRPKSGRHQTNAIRSRPKLSRNWTKLVTNRPMLPFVFSISSQSWRPRAQFWPMFGEFGGDSVGPHSVKVGRNRDKVCRSWRVLIQACPISARLRPTFGSLRRG